VAKENDGLASMSACIGRAYPPDRSSDSKTPGHESNSTATENAAPA
jgi:hypothetical protein